MKVLCTTSSFHASGFPENYEIIYNPLKRRLSEQEAYDLVHKHQPDGIIAGVEPLTRRIMQASKNLKVISRCGVGMDSVDMEAAADLDISVINTPTVTVKPVAELTVGMIYSLVRDILGSDRDMKNNNWNKKNGGLVSEKSIGIIGCGRIGSYVARLLHPTGAVLYGYDPIVKEHQYCKMVSFYEIITHCDIISLHIPLPEDTQNLISDVVLSSMKNGSIIINNSRGGLIDEKALYKHLKNKHIAGAGLDVFDQEPYNGPLCQLDNTILTPHIGSTAGDSRQKMEAESVENLVRLFKEKISV